MLGNDIVDLDHAARQSNWRRGGYLEKVCSAAEQELLKASPTPDLLFWTFWSMKEAAWKALNRVSGLRRYEPARFECGLDPQPWVRYNHLVLRTRTRRYGSAVFSVAALSGHPLDRLQTLFLDNRPDYRAVMNATSASWRLEKDGSLPVLIGRSCGTRFLTSVSHHGRYLAITFSPDATASRQSPFLF